MSGPGTRTATPPPTRSRDDRVIAGVCGGLARRTDIDPVVYRVALGVLGCLGVGLLLYGAGWLLLPRDGDAGSEAERLLRRRIDGPAVLTVLVAMLVVGGLIPADFGSPTVALVVVLGVAALAAQRHGVDLAGALRSVPGRLRSPPRTEGTGPAAQGRMPYGSPEADTTHTDSAAPHAGSFEPHTDPEATRATPTAPGTGAEAPQPPHPPQPPQPATEAPPGWPTEDFRTQPHDPADPATYSPGAPYPAGAPTQWMYGPAGPEAPRTAGAPGAGEPTEPYYLYSPSTLPGYGYDAETSPAAPRRRTGGAFLTLLTLSAALIVAGVLTATTLAGLAPVGPQLILGAVVVTIGAGLLIGTLYGRGRPLVAVGLPLSVLLIGVAAIGHPQGATVLDGYGQRSWKPTGAVAEPYNLAAGEGVLDLTDLPSGSSYEIAADVGFGELRVRVPRTAEVTVRARAGMGAIRLGGSEVANGYDLSATRTLSPTADSDDDTSIELDVGVRMGEVVVHRVSP